MRILSVLSVIFLSAILLGCAPISWAKSYGGAHKEEARSIQQTVDGGYIVAGQTDSFGAGYMDFWVLKLDRDGTVAWQKTYGGGDCDEPYSIQQTRDGGYIVAGYTMSFGAAGRDFWVLRLKPDGAVSWQKTYRGVDWEWAESIQRTVDGGYIVAGDTDSFGADDMDFWVLKLKSDGTISWQKRYGGSDDDRACSIQQTSDGGYIVAGQTYSFGGSDIDRWVLKLNSDGAVSWQKTYGRAGWDEAYSIQQTRDGGYIMAGDTSSFYTGDFWVIKLKSDGTVPFNPASGAQMADTNAVPVDTNCTVTDTTAAVTDTSAIVTDTNAVPVDTNATIIQQAP